MQGRTQRPMWLAAAAIGLLYVGSTLLTPLYPIYRREFHFSELIVTAIYAVYVIGNLAVLFFFGRLSDQIGRRPATLIAVGPENAHRVFAVVLVALASLACAIGLRYAPR